MEKENKFKGMNLFIIGVLIVTIIILVAYIVITSSKNKNVANYTEQTGKVETSQQTQSDTKVEKNRTMKNIAGTYKATSNDMKIELVLYSNGLFEYTDYTYASKGTLGNYYLNEDNIVLENLFNTYSDTSVTTTSGTIKLTLNDDGSITDSKYPIDERKTIIVNLIKNTEQAKELNLSQKLSDTNQSNTPREMTADEKYKVYTDGLKNSLKTISKYGEVFDEGKFESHFFYSEDFLREAGINNVSLRNNGEVYAELSKDSYLAKKYGTNYKIASNIVKVGTTFAGQEGGIIYMINETGKFYYCRIYGAPADSQTHSLEFKEITTLKNIVNVELLNDGEAMIPFAVDINGNIFSLDVN